MRGSTIARLLTLAGLLLTARCASNQGAVRTGPGTSDSAAATIRDTLDPAGTLGQFRGDTAPDTTARPDTVTAR